MHRIFNTYTSVSSVSSVFLHSNLTHDLVLYVDLLIILYGLSFWITLFTTESTLHFSVC